MSKRSRARRWRRKSRAAWANWMVWMRGASCRLDAVAVHARCVARHRRNLPLALLLLVSSPVFASGPDRACAADPWWAGVYTELDSPDAILSGEAFSLLLDMGCTVQVLRGGVGYGSVTCRETSCSTRGLRRGETPASPSIRPQPSPRLWPADLPLPTFSPPPASPIPAPPAAQQQTRLVGIPRPVYVPQNTERIEGCTCTPLTVDVGDVVTCIADTVQEPRWTIIGRADIASTDTFGGREFTVRIRETGMVSIQWAPGRSCAHVYSVEPEPEPERPGFWSSGAGIITAIGSVVTPIVIFMATRSGDEPAAAPVPTGGF